MNESQQPIPPETPPNDSPAQGAVAAGAGGLQIVLLGGLDSADAGAAPLHARARTVTATAWPTATTGTATVTAYPTAATASPTTPAATDCNRAQLSANERYVSRIGTTGCRRGGFSAQLKLGAAQAREVGHHHRARRHQHGTGA